MKSATMERLTKALTNAASALRYCMTRIPPGDPLARKIELTEAEARDALAAVTSPLGTGEGGKG